MPQYYISFKLATSLIFKKKKFNIKWIQLLQKENLILNVDIKKSQNKKEMMKNEKMKKEGV